MTWIYKYVKIVWIKRNINKNIYNTLNTILKKNINMIRIYELPNILTSMMNKKIKTTLELVVT